MSKTYIPIDIASHIYKFYGYLPSLNRVCKSFNKADRNRKLEKYEYMGTKYPLFMYVHQLDETYVNALAIQNKWDDLLLMVYLRNDVRLTRFSLMVAHTFQRKDIALKVLNIFSVSDMYYYMGQINDSGYEQYLWLLMYYGFETGSYVMKSVYDAVVYKIYHDEYKSPPTNMIGFIHPRMYINLNHVQNSQIYDIFSDSQFKIHLDMGKIDIEIKKPRSSLKSYKVRQSEHILNNWDEYSITSYMKNCIKNRYVIDKNLINIFTKYKSLGKCMQNFYHPVIHYLYPYIFYGINIDETHKVIYDSISSLYKNQ